MDVSIRKQETKAPEFARGAVNLASARLGAAALYSTDEFFAPVERMLNDDPAVFIADKYDDHGKWMDGWESRRKRTPGHDWAVIRLAVPGRIHGFDIDTSYFTGNYPPASSIEAISLDEGDPDDSSDWVEILPKTDIGPNDHHYLEVADEALREKVWTHLRVHIYPDGGIARLRVFGEAHFDWSRVPAEEEVDLAYIFHGGRALAWSDSHYGLPAKLISPGRGINMGDGWETARRRGPGHDWAILKLGHAGTIDRIVIDTAHFKGNYPDRFDLLGAFMPDQQGELGDDEIVASAEWTPILQDRKLQMDHIHEYHADAILARGPFTHLRLNIHPDGGVSRMRIYGRKA
jgi:allantoicase